MNKKLIPYLDKYKIYAIGAPIAVTIEVILEILIPYLMSKIIDVGIYNNDMNYVLKMGGLMLIMALLSLICGAVAGRFAAVAGMGFAKEVRQALFCKVQEFSSTNVDKYSTASLVTRLTTDITNTQNVLMMMLRMLVRAPVMLICATGIAIYINARLSLVFFAVIPFMAIALYFIMTRAFPRFQKMLKKYDALNSRVQENLIAIRVVKAYVREGYENEKFREAADNLRRTQMSAEKVVVATMPLMQFAMYGCMIAISWFGGNMIIRGSMLTGEFMSFISYVTQILISLMMVGMIYVNIVISKASISRIVEVLDEEIDIKDNDKGLDELKDASVVFDNVYFSYAKDKDNLTLKDINLKIEAGETVGIIGGTGSGKTTLVQLITRLYDVLSGRVLVGGKDVRDYSLKALRDSVSVVLQNNVLFSGTIKENLKWGKQDATDEEIIEACKAAQAHDFIMSFPDGYETYLEQGGVNLSGGQKQRICIARALLKNPKIIILDDSTSAVDTATDSKIREAFAKHLKDTTTIIIAQRIASVRDADKIIVMNEGKIDAIGTHEELLETNCIYREVYQSQQEGVA
ncbi:MAG: ABC transporter ATP-binding protein [Clostridiales bacterium]|jgi:ATP-binding cassette subfamily B multidrug efflux pump|nr:ABC transporter ATP-binding protein [Clostridiales bacterium]